MYARQLHAARLLLLVAVAAVTLVACSSGSTSSPGSATGGVSTSIGPVGTVGAAHTALGTVLVDASGRTLYELDVDSATAIVCTGVCASIWPPYVVPAGTAPKAGGGVGAPLATVQRPDGTVQVTAAGHPLYTYASDTAAGQTLGQGVQDTGGTWHALTPAGAPVA